MADAKVTKRDMLSFIGGVVADSDLDAEDKALALDFLAHEDELLVRKANGPKSLTKDQLTNESIKDDIALVLDADESDEAGMRASDIAKSLDLNVQKVTALLTQMVKSGRVERVANGKVTLFSLV